MMNEDDSLRLARRKANESLDHLRDIEDMTKADYLATAAMTFAVVLLNARLDEDSERGDKGKSP